MYYLRKFTSRDDLILAIERYLYFYNNKRYQQRLRCMTPMEFHRTAA
ncbi:MAG: IS3 family transposase [Clostridiales bacterium]|nr:IS3 family transposase [Clostridiales bacterium]